MRGRIAWPARAAWRLLIGCVLAGGATMVVAQTPPGEAIRSATPDAERVFADVRASLLQIRTLVAASGQQSSIGSGFLVSADGLAVTNYHVVSQFALEPGAYRLRYLRDDGSEGDLQLLAIDVASDVAVVRMQGEGLPFLEFDARAVEDRMDKGERLFSIGNPLDLGFTIVEGNYNGRVEKSYVDRLHFSGAINPGMSGGPVLTRDKQIAGVNVAKLLSGELVSFLVPARYAAELVARAETSAPMSLEAVRKEIERQMVDWQAALYARLADQERRSTELGPYRIDETRGPWFSCWARTNQDERPLPPVLEHSTQCSMQNWIFLAGDLDTGLVQRSYSYLRSRKLNAAQFAAFIMKQRMHLGGYASKRMAPTVCRDAFVRASVTAPELKTVWCARGYKEFAGLFDVEVIALTRDDPDQALLARLTLRGVSYANAMVETRRMIEGIRWKD